jgi:hypothetical protein
MNPFHGNRVLGQEPISAIRPSLIWPKYFDAHTTMPDRIGALPTTSISSTSKAPDGTDGTELLPVPRLVFGA